MAALPFHYPFPTERAMCLMHSQLRAELEHIALTLAVCTAIADRLPSVKEGTHLLEVGQVEIGRGDGGRVVWQKGMGNNRCCTYPAFGRCT